MKQVLIAKRQAAEHVKYYLGSDQVFRRRANRTRFSEIRAMLLRMAELHQRLAALGERREGILEKRLECSP
jgi:hypothetical protein